MSTEEKAYQTFQIWIKPGHRLFPYFQHACLQAKNLHNTTNFFIRQVFTAMQQTGELQPLQKEVLDLLHENIEQINQVQLAAYQKRLAREQAKPTHEQKVIKPNLYVLPTKEASLLSYGF
ncbi:RNA-guided endonuclease TnpB family protein, partial [Brevibacillus sp. 179-C8.2 HS]